jgi:pyruvate dehydrogenase E2 component (dihydrolipoamide acetyltransferase)
LAGTGKGGRVTKGDVLQAIANGTPMPDLVKAATTTESVTAPAPATPAPAVASTAPVGDLALPEVETFGTFEDVPNSNMRKIIARRLTESKREVPHFYTAVENMISKYLSTILLSGAVPWRCETSQKPMALTTRKRTRSS